MDSVERPNDDHGRWIDSGSGGGFEPRPDATPTDLTPVAHPAWCDPASCTAGTRPRGTHRSARVTVTALGDVLSLFVEEPHHRRTGPLLFIEQRPCPCVGCEPTGLVLLPAADAVAFLAAARTLIEAMTAVTP